MFCCLEPELHELLRFTRMSEAIEVHGSQEDALRAF
jgi:hypothetical protein